MIFLILVVLAILTLVSWMLIKNGFLRFLLGGITLLGLVAAVVATTLNVSSNFGMKKVSETKKEQIYSIAGKKMLAGILLAQPISEKSEIDAYVYSTNAKKSTNSIEKPALNKKIYVSVNSGDKAYKITTKTKYQFKNNLYKLLFGILGTDKKKAKTIVEFDLPIDSWKILSKAQLEKFTAVMSDPASIKDTNTLKLMQEMQEALTSGDTKKATLINMKLISNIVANGNYKATSDSKKETKKVDDKKAESSSSEKEVVKATPTKKKSANTASSQNLLDKIRNLFIPSKKDESNNDNNKKNSSSSEQPKNKPSESESSASVSSAVSEDTSPTSSDDSSSQSQESPSSEESPQEVSSEVENTEN
ncbi:MAG: DUF4811 domain-containing protein [Lactobacillaceae bacterium]|jgi:hypothetical protein|nr:DUF4811 domain-containing protein [Lactobacillaceae bacterium]